MIIDLPEIDDEEARLLEEKFENPELRRRKITKENARQFFATQSGRPESLETLREDLSEEPRLFQNNFFVELGHFSPRTIPQLGPAIIGEVFDESDDENTESSFDKGMSMPCLSLACIPDIIPYTSCSGHGQGYSIICFWAMSLESLEVVVDLADAHGLEIWHDDFEAFEVIAETPAKFHDFSVAACHKAEEMGCQLRDSIFMVDEVLAALKKLPELTEGQKLAQEAFQKEKDIFNALVAQSERELDADRS